jgi:acyl-coenzyme A thioesterase PaaI-like protein
MSQPSPTLFQRLTGIVGPRGLLRAIRFYPPYLGAGIRVTHVDADLREIAVEMRLTAWNQNYLGTHFGGSLFSMCDPFFLFMLIHNLGDGFVVWDKSATIDFVRPGRGLVRARFALTDADLGAIRDADSRQGRSYPRFEATVADETGEVVARVAKTLSVRTRRPA